MIWRDPYVPVIPIPDDIKTRQFRLGSLRFNLLPKQFEFMSATEEFVGYISGVGGGKTRIGCLKGIFLSMNPKNRGLVGRNALPALKDTTERDMLELLHEAELLKQAPNEKTKRALIHCIDPATQENLGYDSEITFQHLEDPEHLRSRHLGWFLIDEGGELRSARAMNLLIGRLRHPSFAGRYKGMVCGNPRGRNWMYDFFFNQEVLEAITCGGRPGSHVPTCHLGDVECNKRMRQKRRAIHSRSYDNYYLPEDYIANMVSSYSEEVRRREVEAEFDVFEGQVFKEFNHDVHVINPPKDWINGRPPREWKRLLAVDVGGSSPWAFLWVAVDPFGTLIFYDEINQITSDTDRLMEAALPKMVDENKKPYNFQAKVIDYENKIAAENLRKGGIVMTNARKMNKSGDGGSVSLLSSYLHPNPKNSYPSWHSRAGLPNAPRAFITTNCQQLIKELPQQQWDKEMGTDNFKDTMDRSIRHDMVDTALYIVREMPHPSMLRLNPSLIDTKGLNKISMMYYEDLRRQKEKENQNEPRRPYRIHRTTEDMLT